MNRLASVPLYSAHGIPRTRGDEPFGGKFSYQRQHVFPAPAGMNRLPASNNNATGRIPRTRGDEPPVAAESAASEAYSPHPRG